MSVRSMMNGCDVGLTVSAGGCLESFIGSMDASGLVAGCRNAANSARLVVGTGVGAIGVFAVVEGV